MDHAKSFDSLLSLMPADVYFGKDNSVRLAVVILYGGYTPW